MISALNHQPKADLFLTFLIVALLCAKSNSVYQKHYVFSPQLNNRVKFYELTLTEGPVQPDNFLQNGYLINGQFPGPTIFANQFDILVITVHNELPNPTSIHFHGLYQKHTVASDGVPYVTQDPIKPNETFVYHIDVGTQTGTYMYHGHVNFDIVWLHGAIVIRDTPSDWKSLGEDYSYDEGHEHTFLLEQIFHYPLDQYYKDVFELGVGGPDEKSYPINGHSFGSWPENNGTAPGYEVVTVTPGKTYRFRVINIATEAYFRFSIQDHSFKVIEMDGIICQPVWTDHLEINAGQRYSILVTMNSTDLNNFWIQTQNMNGGPDNGRAILHYHGAPDPTTMRKQIFSGTTPEYLSTATSWILSKLTPNPKIIDSSNNCNLNDINGVPRRANRRIFIDTLMKRVNGIQHFFINGHQYDPPSGSSPSYLTQVRDGVNITRNNKNIYEILEGEVIDLVIQNRVTPNPEPDEGPCSQHPWHLHGQSFFVVGEGSGTAEPQNLNNVINQNIIKGKFQYRDVATLFAWQKPGQNSTVPSTGCGWMVLRFVANNPGLWLTHCHITEHMLMGKAFVLYVHSENNPRLYNE